MSFSRHRSPIHFNYSFKGITLNRIFFYKDLDIHFTTSLNFKTYHLNVTVYKLALQILGFLKRNIKMFTSCYF